MKFKAILTAAALFFPSLAQANPICLNADLAQSNLKDEYGETPQASGITNDMQIVVQFYANTETGTWTIITLRADGMACFMGSGVAFSATPTPPAPEGEES